MCRQLTIIPLQSTTMECRDTNSGKKNKKTEHGSITLEAAVFLTLFILFYVAMMDLIQIAKAQVLLQYSINEAAKKISVYSYVLTKAGLTEKRSQTLSQSAQVKDIFVQIDKIQTALAGNDAKGVIDGVSKTAEEVKAIEPEDVDDLILSYLKDKLTEGMDDAIFKEIVKREVESQIEMMSSKSADRFLRDLGIRNGLEGLDYKDSVWGEKSVDGFDVPVLEIQVTYTIDFHLGYLELQPRTYTLCAKTAIW